MRNCLSLLAGSLQFHINAFRFHELKALNFSNEGKKLRRIKPSQIVLLFDGLAFFPVRRDTPDTLTIIGIIEETTQKIYKHHQIQSLWVLRLSNGKDWKTLFDI